MIESLDYQQNIMNAYGGGGNGNSADGTGTSAGGWENILLTNYFGDGGAPAGGGGAAAGAAAAADATNGAPMTNDDGAPREGSPPTAITTTTYDPSNYAHYLHANYLSKGTSGGSESTAANGDMTAPAAMAMTNAYYAAPPPPNATGLNYATNGGYSINMPGAASHLPGVGGQYNPQYGQPPTAAGGGGASHPGHSRYISGESHVHGSPSRGGAPSTLPTQQQLQGGAQYNMPQFTLHENGAQRGSYSDESQNNDPYTVDYGNSVEYNNYYNPATGVPAAVGGAQNYPPPPGIPTNNNFGGSASAHNPQNYNPTNISEMDYCDALLRGMDDPSFGWLAGAFGGVAAGAAPPTDAPTNPNFRSARNGYTNYPGGPSHPQTTHMGLQQPPPATAAGGVAMGGAERMALPSALAPNPKGTALDAFFLAQQQQQQQQQQQSAKKSHYTRSHAPSTRSSSRAHATTTTTSSTRLSPNRADHSSLPSVQIDPLLEQITLTVSAVSLQPLSGNQVVRHIRTKTDDVITRFLPCVDFLVNCQQELRQGLQLAQRSRSRNAHRARSSASVTPRQFHANYVAPLPTRFERHNESIMAREHLMEAKNNLDSLVRDAHACVPQGCDHVKNAFLGGMRENESWGLRKWLSQHGGAGSICNDLEEVMRHVKALKKEDETTKRLAEMLRPIARQAHERLKKDVPQAYQEQSSAHPYLPFFHRLEACLKQMATYDPEEDDVICLDDSDDDEEEEDVKVVVPKSSSVSSPVAVPAKSSAVKKRTTRAAKRKSEEEISISKWVESYSTTTDGDGNDVKRSRIQNPEEEFARQFFGRRSSVDNDDEEEEEKKPAVSSKGAKGEHEVICLDDSDSDDDDENDNDANAAAGQDNLGQILTPLPAAEIQSPPPTMQDYDQTTTSTTSLQQPPYNEANNAYISSMTVAEDLLGGEAAGPTAPTAAQGPSEEQWRCAQCTFLNEVFSQKCVMCNSDDDSADTNEVASDDLANFLGGSSFLDSGRNSFSAEDMRDGAEGLAQNGGGGAGIGGILAAAASGCGGGSSASQQQQWRALQSADARELESLAEHISNGGSLPKQAHHNIDTFWGTMDTFPRILLLFRTILQHPSSHRFMEDESHLFMIGMPDYRSVVRHPLCFHEIVSVLSRSEDAVKYPHITMRLSNGKLPNSEGLQDWNMWNGVHLIEAIDLVLLNSLAYNVIKEGRNNNPSSQQQLLQQRTETESLRNVLWEGVNSMLKERLRPQERRDHLPQRRNTNCGFVLVNAKEGGGI